MTTIDELIPHRAPMSLLDRVVSQGERVCCEAEVRVGNPLLGVGGLPGWALLEYIAQAAAVMRGLEGPGEGGRPGYLVAVRDARFVALVEVGTRLEVQVWRDGSARGGMASLQGEVTSLGRCLCHATITVKEG